MTHKLSIDIQGEDVLVVYNDEESLKKSKHVIEGMMGHFTRVNGRSYVLFYDPIPYYCNTVLNHFLRGGKKNEEIISS